LRDLKDAEAKAYDSLRQAEIPLYDKLRAATRASTKEDVKDRARRPAKELRDLGVLIEDPASPYPDSWKVPVDQVTLLQPKSVNGLAVDHIVAIKELLDDWPDVKKLTLAQQIVLVNDPVNLMAIDASANGSKSDWSWRAWPNRGSYYTTEALARGAALDAAARSHLQKEIMRMLGGG
jgi:hypothetical protein